MGRSGELLATHEPQNPPIDDLFSGSKFVKSSVAFVCKYTEGDQLVTEHPKKLHALYICNFSY